MSGDLRETLRTYGFVEIAAFKTANPNGTVVKPSILANRIGIYAFLAAPYDKTNLYIGKTRRSLRMRILEYCNRKDLAGPRRVHRSIRGVLIDGGTVGVWVLELDRDMPVDRGPLHFDACDGIESWLIRTLDPQWNPTDAP